MNDAADAFSGWNNFAGAVLSSAYAAVADLGGGGAGGVHFHAYTLD